MGKYYRVLSISEILFLGCAFYFLWEYTFNPTGAKRGIKFESTCMESLFQTKEDYRETKGGRRFPKRRGQSLFGPKKKWGAFSIQCYLGYQRSKGSENGIDPSIYARV